MREVLTDARVVLRELGERGVDVRGTLRARSKAFPTFLQPDAVTVYACLGLMRCGLFGA
ncbi:MAG: hypothetical protein AVDCRST_MAG86-152 [uncultured Truepera sp.]|uniref:Uncharacterized protein n=1 Tax=uncultured Truepera sp. TaxID=543023 RepID=A0A6J4UMT4_9DEIN|nr:MAG: hypothetical protein AVDCRST_MAG86-152 [uncultured Truepera sp.]